MGVASGCGEQEAGMASGSGWNLWVWLLGVVVRRYIDFLILLILTPLVSVLFCSSSPTLCSFKKMYKQKQGNTTNLNISFSMEIEKRAAQVGTRTHDILLTRQMLYQLSYRGSSAGWPNQGNTKATSLT